MSQSRSRLLSMTDPPLAGDGMRLDVETNEIGWPRALRILALSLLVACFAYGSLLLYAGLPDEGIWLANGVLLAILLRTARRDWPWFLTINFILNTLLHKIYFMAPIGELFRWRTLFSYSMLNVIEVGLAAFLISRKVKGRPDIAHLPTLGWLALFGLIFSCGVSALLASLIAPYMERGSQYAFQQKWYISEALGMAIMTPLILAIHLDEIRSIIAKKRVLETFGLLALVAALAYFVFWQDQFPLAFVLFPALSVVMYRLGTSGSAAAVFLVFIPAIYFTLVGRGPFSLVRSGSIHARVSVLYVFFFLMVGMVYSVAVVIAGRRKLEAELRQSEENYRILAEHSWDIILRTGLDGLIQYISPSVSELLGWSPEELTGKPIRDLVHPEYLADYDRMCQELVVNPELQVAIYQIKCRNGEYLWVESNARLVGRPASGQVGELVWIIRDVSLRVAERQQLTSAFKLAEALATIDPLTNLSNRRAFDGALTHQWQNAVRGRTPLSLLMIDVDDFKVYNDLYGHLAGDGCLIAVAETLKRNLFRPLDLAVRFGGEEFAVLLPDTTAAGAAEIAERLRVAVGALTLEPQPDKLAKVTVSIGTATLTPLIHENPYRVLALADEALYHAKGSGKNRVVVA